eukprot:g1579.t1
MWSLMPCPRAAAEVSDYYGHDRFQPRSIMTGGESIPTKMLVVRVFEAQHLRRVQVLGKQDPYVRAKLYCRGLPDKVGECRSSTHHSGGKNPNWRSRAKRVLTFYVPEAVGLSALTLKLDIINNNPMVDNFVGTTGRIDLDQTVGSDQMWWEISTGGMLMAKIDVMRSDRDPWLPSPTPAPSAVGADRSGNAARTPTAPPAPYGGGNGGTEGVGWRTNAALNTLAAGIEASSAGAGTLPSYEVDARPRPPPYALGASDANGGGGFQTSLAFPVDGYTGGGRGGGGGDELPILYASDACGGGGGVAASSGRRDGRSSSGGTAGGTPILPETGAIPFFGEVVAADSQPSQRPNQRPSPQTQPQQQRRNLWNGWSAVPRPMAASRVSPLPRMMRWRHEFFMLNLITVHVFETLRIRSMVEEGQNPYVRATLYHGTRKVKTCRSSAHGRSPALRARAKHVLNFYVPETVRLDDVSMRLDILTENGAADILIGTTGRIDVDQGVGSDQRWSISTGGRLHAVIGFVRNGGASPAPSPPASPVSAHRGVILATAPTAPRAPVIPPAGGGGGDGGNHGVQSPTEGLITESVAAGILPSYEDHVAVGYPFAPGPPTANHRGGRGGISNALSTGGGGGGGGDSPALPEAWTIPSVEMVVAEPYIFRRALNIAATTVPIWRAEPLTPPTVGVHGALNLGVEEMAGTSRGFGFGVVVGGGVRAAPSAPPMSPLFGDVASPSVLLRT